MPTWYWEGNKPKNDRLLTISCVYSKNNGEGHVKEKVSYQLQVLINIIEILINVFLIKNVEEY